jgi:hypothetical protein
MSSEWSDELNQFITVRVDLEIADAENAPVNIVAPAIEREGRQIFAQNRVGK